jgi:subtilase family serine protease
MSADYDFNEEDVLLDSINVDPILSGNSVNINSDFTIPETAGVGDQYVIFIADADESIYESNEENNIKRALVSVLGPDLIFYLVDVQFIVNNIIFILEIHQG